MSFLHNWAMISSILAACAIFELLYLFKERNDLRKAKGDLTQEVQDLKEKISSLHLTEKSAKYSINELKKSLQWHIKEAVEQKRNYDNILGENSSLKKQVHTLEKSVQIFSKVSEENIDLKKQLATLERSNKFLQGTKTEEENGSKNNKVVIGQNDFAIPIFPIIGANNQEDLGYRKRTHEKYLRDLNSWVEGSKAKNLNSGRKDPTSQNASSQSGTSSKEKPEKVEELLGTPGPKVIKVKVSSADYQKYLKMTKEFDEQLKSQQQEKERKNQVKPTQPVNPYKPANIPRKEEVKDYENNKLKHFCESSIIEGYRYHCMLWYLPKRMEHNFEGVELNRQAVYGFKDGKNTAFIADAVAKVLKECFSPQDLSSSSFLVIPASTKARHDIRFKTFCSIICERTGLANGFNAITINQDREALKGHLNSNKVSNLIYNPAYINGRTMFLFDDVLTTGASFLQNAKELRKRGSKSIIGIFLARTASNKSKIDFR